MLEVSLWAERNAEAVGHRLSWGGEGAGDRESNGRVQSSECPFQSTVHDGWWIYALCRGHSLLD